MPTTESTSGAERTLLPPDRLVHEQEASLILGLSRSTLQKLRMLRRGPKFVRLGRACRYSLLDLAEYLAKQPREGGRA